MLGITLEPARLALLGGGIEPREWRFAAGRHPPLIYGRTGAATAPTQAGGIVHFATDVARITDRGLLQEGAATNLLQRSQEFDQATWARLSGGSAVTVDPDAALAPDGTMTMDRIRVLTSGNSRGLYQTVTAANAIHTATLTLKADTVTGAEVGLYDGGAYRAGVPEIVSGPGAVSFVSGRARMTGLSATVPTTVRLTTSAAVPAGPLQMYVFPNTAAVQNAADAVFVWGAQLEASSQRSSYIPTTTAAATRGADSAGLIVPDGCAEWAAEYGTSGAAGGSGLTPGAGFDLTTGRPWIGLGEELKRVRFF